MRKAILCSILCIALCSCSAPKEYSGEFFAMDTVMDYKIYSASEKPAKLMEDEIKRLDSLLDRNKEDSIIYRLNKTRHSESSDELDYILRESDEISKMTDGAFDITIAPIMDLWGFHSKEYHVPTDDEISVALSSVGYSNVKSSETEIQIPEKSSIDLGAVAKGYTSDRITALLKNSGVKSAIISLGGNVCAIGSRPDGNDWNVGITDPADNSKIACTVKVKDKVVITSGPYQRFFERDGNIYHHIINPKTGKNPENNLASVTIVSENGTRADALSTALFVMGIEDGISLWKDTDFFDAVFIDKEGKIYITDGLKNSFSSDKEYTVISKNRELHTH